MEHYEVFLSYHHANTAVAKPLYDALVGKGLKVFFDDKELASHESITGRLESGLARSKVLLAVYSKTYPTRPACQFELTAAFLAAQRVGDPRDRVLVVNPDEGTEHIEPIQLRDAVFEKLHETDTPKRFKQLATKIKRKVTGIKGALGESRLLCGVPWHGRRPISSPGFVGRLPAMWEIHSSLHASELRPITGDAGPAVAQLIGIGGQGKTMLAEEYALRFASAYPSGVFWLTVPADKAKSRATREASRKQQIEALAASLGAPIAGRTEVGDIEAVLREELERRGEAHLWVVDDVPDGMQADELRAWFAPHRLGKTLLTTQTHGYEELARKIKLEELSPQEAGELLARHCAPEGESEREEAARLAEDLAHHAMALKVAGAALKVAAGPIPYADFRRELENPSKDALEFAAELTDTLATGHDPSIAKTLLLSVARVGAEATDVLRLASQLANTPIPSSFIDRVLGAVDKRDQSEARERGMRARKDLAEASLSELVENGTAISVHSLVARTMRFAERKTPDRQQQLRSAATAVLNDDLDPDRAEGVSADAESLIPHARQLAVTATTSEETTLASHLAIYDYRRGAFASARELEEQVLKEFRELLGEHHPDTLTAMGSLAATLRTLGELDEARKLGEQALNGFRELLGERDPHTLKAMNGLAGTLCVQRELDQARKLQKQALKGFRTVLGEHRHETLSAMSNLAEILRAQGELDEARNDLGNARKLQKQALNGFRELLGERDPHTLAAMNGLAGILYEQGKLGKARKLEEQALKGFRTVLGKHHPLTLAVMSGLAGILYEQGKLGKARKLEEQALKGFRTVLGDRHPDTLTAMSRLAVTLRAQGELGKARELEEQVPKFAETPRNQEMKNAANSPKRSSEPVQPRRRLDFVLALGGSSSSQTPAQGGSRRLDQPS